MKTLIIGYGEVGSALVSIISRFMDNKYADYSVHDPNKNMVIKGKYDLLHVCIPYSDNFIEQVNGYIEEFEPKLTIIHSTVAVGTTRKIKGAVVHSFVRGAHPYMTDMIKQTKHIGAVNPKDAIEASKILSGIGFDTIIHYSPEATEFGKLFDTTYFGVCVAWVKEAKKMADAYGIDWSNIAQINHTYNTGSEAIGHKDYVRPEITPMPGKIGGHCVVTNAEILQKDFKSKLLDAITEAE